MFQLTWVKWKACARNRFACLLVCRANGRGDGSVMWIGMAPGRWRCGQGCGDDIARLDARRSLSGENNGWRQDVKTKLVRGRFGKSAETTEAKPEKSRQRTGSGLGFVA